MAMLTRISCLFTGGLRNHSLNRTLNRWNHYKAKQKKAFYDVEGVVTKDTILFRYEDAATMKKGQYFSLALALVPIFSFMGYGAYSLKSDFEPNSKDSAVRNEKVSSWKKSIFRVSVGVGLTLLTFGASLFWTLRTLYTVRRLVLKQGGKYASIQTYGILGNPSGYTDLPVAHCSTIFRGKQRFIIKVREHRFNYQLYVEDGTFCNRAMFDKTVGILRNI